MKYIFLILVLVQLARSEQNERQGKFLNLFQFVQFENTNCTGGKDNDTEGTCYTSKQCTAFEGENLGECANGYGVCCNVERGCGSGNEGLNSTVFTSDVTAGGKQCKYTVTADDSICYVRLDIEKFVLAQPDTSSGACDSDTFTTTIGGIKLCGEVTEGYPQHLYIPVVSGDELGLVVTAIDENEDRVFSIKVSLIECDSPVIPPEGCQQYYYGETMGTVTSFNWAPANDTVTDTRQLQDQSVKTCFRQEKDMCKISLSECTNATAIGNAFALTGDNTATKAGNADKAPTSSRKRRDVEDYFRVMHRQARAAATAIGGACNMDATGTTDGVDGVSADCSGLGDGVVCWDKDTATTPAVPKVCALGTADGTCVCECYDTKNYKAVGTTGCTSKVGTDAVDCAASTGTSDPEVWKKCNGAGQECSSDKCACKTDFLKSGTDDDECSLDASTLPYAPGTCGTTKAMDYLHFHCATKATTKPTICYGHKFCGTVLNIETVYQSGNADADTLTSYMTPFEIEYKTDGEETDDKGNAGFCLKYKQGVCLTK